MAFFLIEYNELGNAAAREEKRGDHIAYRKGLGRTMPLAGPLLGEDGQTTGSVVILEADDETAAERLAQSDPYVTAGVFEVVSIRRYRIAAMKPPQDA